LSRLRGKFPDRPIAAFTASATRHVRHDILTQLELRDPDKYIASFHRPNLRYLVRECDSTNQTDLLVTALQHYAEGNVIVYSPTISRVEETVDFLEDQGIAAVGYHAKMDSGARRRNQERWMSDEVRVLVGTIAFGLGINKATVRAVIHLALPKSLEQFYQEAGRAGRDGQPADCILLWRKQDAGLLAYFANQILDQAERQRAWERYNVIRAFVESGPCRHRQICTHFGEIPKWESCGACDMCGALPEWLKEQVSPAVSRRRASAGMTGARAVASATGAAEVDAELREYLREWRRATAKEQSVPAYVVLHDTSLDEICRVQPASIAQLMTITGIGQRKADLYGQEILSVLRRYQEGARAAALPEKKTAPARETLQLLAAGKNFEEIAQIRGRQMGTVVNAVAGLVEKGEIEFDPAWIDRNKLAAIEAACTHLGLQRLERLKTLKDALPPEITYDEIRLVVARFRRAGSRKSTEISA
jgi:ATP-dependent DNA helicase RecQ